MAGELARRFCKHLVPISITFDKGDEEEEFIITSFVMSVRNHWFLVTAGHCYDYIGKIKSSGYKIIKSRLIDSLGIDPKHLETIPFPFDHSPIIRGFERKEFDYGSIYLTPYFRQLLEKNGIQPIDEEVWKIQPTDFDFYELLGIPAMLVSPEEGTGNLDITSLLIRVDRIEQPPNGFPETDIPLFYGRIRLGEEISNIEGMSGGPIFGFKMTEEGVKYWLVALQSTWLSNSQIVKGCPTIYLGNFLEKFIKKIYDKRNLIIS